MHFISLLYLRHIAIVSFFAPFYKYWVLGIFKGHTLHIIDVCQTSRYGVVFCSFIQVLGIRYFQMLWAFYILLFTGHLSRVISFVLIYKYYVLGIFKCNALYILKLFYLTPVCHTSQIYICSFIYLQFNTTNTLKIVELIRIHLCT